MKAAHYCDFCGIVKPCLYSGGLPPIVRHMPVIFLPLLLLALSACAQMHPPLQTRLQHPLHHIDVAALEFDNELRIRRLSPMVLLMGSSGLVMDNLVVAAQGYEYRKKVGDVGMECAKVFKSTLIHHLRQSGYQVHDRHERYWDYFKPSRKAIRDGTDAILRIKMEQVGFWANGLEQPYRASALVMAEMIDPRSRKTLYRNRFVIGLSKKDVHVLKDFIGTTELVERGSNAPSFENFDALLARGEESRFDLLNVVALAARKISDDLKPEKQQHLLAVDRTTIMPVNVSRKQWRHLNPSAIPEGS